MYSESSVHKTMFEARVVTICKVLGARVRMNYQDNKSVAQSTVCPVQSRRRIANTNEMAII